MIELLLRTFQMIDTHDSGIQSNALKHWQLPRDLCKFMDVAAKCNGPFDWTGWKIAPKFVLSWIYDNVTLKHETRVTIALGSLLRLRDTFV